MSVKSPNPHFQPYYQSRILLIQLITEEFIISFRVIRQLILAANRYLESPKGFKEENNSLFQLFTHLLGPSSEVIPLFDLEWTAGPLTKLKNYCEQFANHVEKIDQSAALYKLVHQGWLDIVHYREQLTLVKLGAKLTPTVLKMIKSSLLHLEVFLKNIAKQMIRILNSFCTNENVVYFVLRKKEKLIEIYGTNFIQKLFKCSLKERREILESLAQKYHERGFSHLASSFL